MRNPNRLDNLYDTLKEIHKKEFPDWRLTQFIANMQEYFHSDMYYVEDDKVIGRVEDFVKAIKEKPHA